MSELKFTVEVEQLRSADLSCVVCTAVCACSIQVSPRSSRLCRQCCGRNHAEPLSSEVPALCWFTVLVCSHQTASAPAHLPIAAGKCGGGRRLRQGSGKPGLAELHVSCWIVRSSEVPAWCSVMALGAEPSHVGCRRTHGASGRGIYRNGCLFFPDSSPFKWSSISQSV